MLQLEQLLRADSYLKVTKPVCGRNAFIHESHVHVSAVLSGHAGAFEPYEPSIVGQQRSMWFGSTTSVYSLETLASSMNVKLSDTQIKDIMGKIAEKVQERGYATDKEVKNFISETIK